MYVAYRHSKYSSELHKSHALVQVLVSFAAYEGDGTCTMMVYYNQLIRLTASPVFPDVIGLSLSRLYKPASQCATLSQAVTYL